MIDKQSKTFDEILELTAGTAAVRVPGASASFAYASDLLSDVMGHCGDESVLITIQNHLNTIAVCTLVGIEIIVLCHDRAAPDDMMAAAEREGIAIIVSPKSQFEVSVALSSLAPSSKS